MGEAGLLTRVGEEEFFGSDSDSENDL